VWSGGRHIIFKWLPLFPRNLGRGDSIAWPASCSSQSSHSRSVLSLVSDRSNPKCRNRHIRPTPATTSRIRPWNRGALGRPATGAARNRKLDRHVLTSTRARLRHLLFTTPPRRSRLRLDVRFKRRLRAKRSHSAPASPVTPSFVGCISTSHVQFGGPSPAGSQNAKVGTPPRRCVRTTSRSSCRSRTKRRSGRARGCTGRS
jgi:hypothetical protein